MVSAERILATALMVFVRGLHHKVESGGHAVVQLKHVLEHVPASSLLGRLQHAALEDS